jgi:hypothetical protein
LVSSFKRGGPGTAHNLGHYSEKRSRRRLHSEEEISSFVEDLELLLQEKNMTKQEAVVKAVEVSIDAAASARRWANTASARAARAARAAKAEAVLKIHKRRTAQLIQHRMRFHMASRCVRAAISTALTSVSLLIGTYLARDLPRASIRASIKESITQQFGAIQYLTDSLVPNLVKRFSGEPNNENRPLNGHETCRSKQVDTQAVPAVEGDDPAEALLSPISTVHQPQGQQCEQANVDSSQSSGVVHSSVAEVATEEGPSEDDGWSIISWADGSVCAEAAQGRGQGQAPVSSAVASASLPLQTKSDVSATKGEIGAGSVTRGPMSGFMGARHHSQYRNLEKAVRWHLGLSPPAAFVK